MYCEKCGSRLSEGAAYCASCGNPVAKAGETPAEKDGSRSPRDRLARLAGRTRGERLLALGTVLALVVAVVGFLLLDTSDEEPAQDAYTREADRLCLAAKEGIAAAGRTALADDAPAARLRYATSMLDTVTSWKVAFDGLEPTPGHVREAEELHDAIVRVIIELGGLARTARSGSEAQVTAQAARTDEATTELEAAIAALGLPRCAGATITPTGPS